MPMCLLVCPLPMQLFCIGQESWCLPYAFFFFYYNALQLTTHYNPNQHFTIQPHLNLLHVAHQKYTSLSYHTPIYCIVDQVTKYNLQTCRLKHVKNEEIPQEICQLISVQVSVKCHKMQQNHQYSKFS